MRERNFSTVYPWFQETEQDGQPCAEDQTFCLRAGELGYPIYVDPRVKTGHRKSVTYNEALYVGLNMAHSVVKADRAMPDRRNAPSRGTEGIPEPRGNGADVLPPLGRG